MSKNKPKKIKVQQNNSILRVVILISIFALLMSAIIFKNNMGIVGEYVSKGAFIAFGLTAYILPPFILFLFFAIRNKDFWSINGRKVIVSSMLLLIVVLFSATFFRSGEGFNGMISNSYNQAMNYTGVGIVFTSIYYILNLLIADIGIYVLTFLAFFLSYFYFFDKSIKDFFISFFMVIKNWISKLFAKTDETINQNNTVEEEVPVRGKEKKVYPIETEKFDKVEPKISYYNPTDSSKNTQKVESNTSYSQVRVDYDEDYQYVKPTFDLLNDVKASETDGESILLNNAKIIENTLRSFDIESEVVNINNGPTVTSYEVKPQSGIKVSKIVNLSNDLSMALASPGIRIEAPIPGKPYVGIEVPNRNKDIVTFKTLISTEEFNREDDDITVAVGKDLFGKPLYAKINAMPHLLIAGATGSGKSVLMNAIIMSIIYKYSPKEVEFIMIDPKMVELKVYSGIPHLRGRKVVTKATEATASLNEAVKEMVSRFEKFSKTGCRDIKAYNAKVEEQNLGADLENEEKLEKMPYLVVVIDELSDLMMEASKDVENYITRLAQMGRASGVHLIIATQRPSVNVITGIIKANIPSRIAFQVASSIDSRTIIDMAGAEKLLGKGDMLYYPGQLPKPKRAQGAFLTDKEVERVVSFVNEKNETVKSNDSFNKEIEKVSKPVDNVEDLDELFEDAVDFVVRENQASISAIQRRFRVGYARAGRIIDQMTRKNIISEQDGSKPRNVLISIDDLENLNNEGDVDEFSE